MELRAVLLHPSLLADAFFVAGASTSKGCSTKGPDCQAAKGRQAAPFEGNEMLTGVKLDKLGQVIYAKYTTGTPRPTICGVRAHQSKIKFIPPKETPKKPAPPLYRQEKHLE
jgi:hypothetical protein